MSVWSISINICKSGDASKSRDFECNVTTQKVTTAISAAIFKASLASDELVHTIHVGPPRKG